MGLYPLQNAFVPIPDIIQIPEKSSSDSCTKYDNCFYTTSCAKRREPRSCAR